MQNDCIFSNPVVLDSSGNVVAASGSSLPFQFERATCVSSSVSGSPVSVTIVDDQLQLAFIFGVFILFFCGFYLVTYIFRRNV